ncbi:MAG: glycosyltransferase family 4 protein [Acidobacteriota bacterium]|nr:glycosyltransferase family 4 protein [Acidobacteriota bacterium]
MRAQIVSIVEARTVTGPAKNLIRFASENRDRLSFHFLTYVRAKSQEQAARHTNDFIEACRQASLPVSVVWERSRFDPHLLTSIPQAICSLGPRLVQTHSIKSHLLLSLVRKKIGVPWNAFHHGYTAEDLKMRCFNQLDRFSLPRAAQVVTVCEAFAGGLVKYGIPRKKIRVLHNSLNAGWAQRSGIAAEAAAIRRSLPDKGVSPVLLCVGRFSREKGHANLLEAVARLRRSEKPIPFTVLLIGDGPLRAATEARVREHKLESVVFAGQKRDLPPYFAAANLLVLPSLSEGSPNVLLEAMSAKLPIVATMVGGVGEIVADGETALLVPRNNPAELAGGIERLLENPALRQELAARAHQRLIDRFSPAEYDSQLLGIYDEALGHPIAGQVSPLAGARRS